ncbi:MAG: carboxypeptidase regulatory-like domain-containing protein [Bacteroidetes bacterium]|nr:carboxypeptidase regulatory-like domain-containing protein [Bacteroidota bacterium]
MIKTSSALLFALLAQQAVTAQTHNINGSVIDGSGNSVPYTFIQDSPYKYAAYSDSTGHFTIPVHPDSKLDFGAPGYRDTLISPGNSNSDLQIALKRKGSGDAGSATGAVSARVTEQKNDNQIESFSTGGVIAPAHQRGDLRGSPYLFDSFVHGYIISSANELVNNPNYLFDYDKTTGRLLMTQNGGTINAVNWDQINSFTLFNNAGNRYDFAKAPAIDQSHYVQVLASGGKYKIYKLIKTQFVKADYVNNGAAPHGHDYDEYVDDADYYVVDAQTNQPVKISLRKKSIKEAFAKDADKLNKFMSETSGRIDDAYLAKLGAAMNQ